MGVSGWRVWAKERAQGFPATNLIGGFQSPVESRDLIRRILESQNFFKKFYMIAWGNHFEKSDKITK